MADTRIVISSPFSEPTISDLLNDTPIRILQSEGDFLMNIKRKILFQESTGINQAKRSLNEEQQNDKMISNQVHLRKVSTPLESISNFSPYTVKNSINNSEPESFKLNLTKIISNQQKVDNARLAKDSTEEKNIRIGDEKERLQIWNEIKDKMERKEKQMLLRPMRIHCHFKGSNNQQGKEIKEYFVPQCQSSIYSEEIPFHESRFTENSCNPKVDCSSKKRKGFEYAFSQIQELKKNVGKIELITEKFKSIYFNTSVIISDEDKIDESFLYEIKSNLIQILQNVEEEEKQNKTRKSYFPLSENHGSIQQLSSISENFVKSESPDRQAMKILQWEESIIFSEPRSGQEDEAYLFTTPIQKNNYYESETPSDKIMNRSQVQQIENLSYNVNLNSSGELISKKMRRKYLRHNNSE